MSSSIRPAGKIDTREELINALTEAAELEHGVLVQYLFAAFSMKRHVHEGVTWEQLERIREWERTLLEVAREEMAHLATVNNLLVAVGGAQHFNRPNFPVRQAYYPSNVRFTLERFSLSALDRFIAFERPERSEKWRALDPAPDELVYTRVGDLYGQIRRALEEMPWDPLYLQTESAQDGNDWGVKLRVSRVKTQAGAVNAVKFIIEDGEGAPEDREKSHFAAFVRMRDELARMMARHPGFDPARPVAENPMTRPHRDAARDGCVTLITHPLTVRIAELFNSAYGAMLLAQMEFYAWDKARSSIDQRSALRSAAGAMMSAVLRPLGELLTLMPATAGAPAPTAGPGFELYANLRLSSNTRSSWICLHDRFAHYARAAEKLVEDGAPPRLRLVAENLHAIAENLRRHIPPPAGA